MKKSELIELLKDIPDDATICVQDSYGAFHEFQQFGDHYFKQLVSVYGKKQWYWVLDTCGDEEGFEGEWEYKTIREYPCYPQKALDLFKWKGYSPGLLDLTTPLSQWCPNIRGGTKQDQQEVAQAAEKYWNDMSEFLGIPVEELYDMTLRDLK